MSINAYQDVVFVGSENSNADGNGEDTCLKLSQNGLELLFTQGSDVYRDNCYCAT